MSEDEESEILHINLRKHERHALLKCGEDLLDVNAPIDDMFARGHVQLKSFGIFSLFELSLSMPADVNPKMTAHVLRD